MVHDRLLHGLAWVLHCMHDYHGQRRLQPWDAATVPQAPRRGVPSATTRNPAAPPPLGCRYDMLTSAYNPETPYLTYSHDPLFGFWGSSLQVRMCVHTARPVGAVLGCGLQCRQETCMAMAVFAHVPHCS